jgi:hypothetical protein
MNIHIKNKKLNSIDIHLKLFHIMHKSTTSHILHEKVFPLETN